MHCYVWPLMGDVVSCKESVSNEIRALAPLCPCYELLVAAGGCIS